MPIVRKNRRLALTAGAGALGLAVAGLFAASLAASTPNGGGGEPRGLGRTARRLGLSEDQREQIRGILKTHAAEIETQMRAARSGRKALGDAMAAQPVDEGRIREQALALGGVRADGAVLRARIRSEVWPILTAEQQEKAKQLRSLRGKREKRRMDALERWLQDGA
jgi:Spy/CpxP family protein refolding chaperone